MVKIIPNDPYGRRGVLDLDGTLNQFLGWEGEYKIYPPLEQAEEYLKKWTDEGWELILATARPDIEEVVKPWLAEIGWDKYFIEVWQKPFGMWYLDDKNVYFDGNFRHADRDIKKLEAWYKKAPNSIFGFIEICVKKMAKFLDMLVDLYLNNENEDFFEGRF